MFKSAYTHMINRTDAFVHLELTEPLQTVNNDLNNAFRFRITEDEVLVTGDAPSHASPYKNAVNVNTENNGRTVKMVLQEVSKEINLRLYDNDNNVYANTLLNFTEVLEQQYNDNINNPDVSNNKDKEHKVFLSIDSNKMFRVWHDTFEWNLGGVNSSLTARIIDKDDNKVKCLLKGYHIRNPSFAAYEYRDFNKRYMQYYGGVDLYKHLYVLEPLENKEYYFVTELNSGHVFIDTVLYSNGEFVKELSPDERWRNIGTID